MAYYDTINLVAGDDKPEISFILRDANTAKSGSVLDPEDPTTWAVIDITNPTIKVKFRALGSTTVLDTLTCVKTAPYANGACYMPWNLTTLDVTAGTYEGEIELVYSDGRILTLFDRLKFKIRAQF
tara:strand:+ start:277 stop:654 length:378 start_codon:yes stop_codon:yes gene_type:complete